MSKKDDDVINLKVYSGAKQNTPATSEPTATDMFEDIKRVFEANIQEVGACDDMFLVFAGKDGRVGYIAQALDASPVLTMIGTIEVLKMGVIHEYSTDSFEI